MNGIPEPKRVTYSYDLGYDFVLDVIEDVEHGFYEAAKYNRGYRIRRRFLYLTKTVVSESHPLSLPTFMAFVNENFPEAVLDCIDDILNLPSTEIRIVQKK